jgi:predicted outer membrane repeat protein
VEDGDVIELTESTYEGAGNRDVRFRGKGVTIWSTARSPDTCTIDPDKAARGFRFVDNEGECSELVGITIKNGSADLGGAIRCASASPRLTRCILAQNEATTYGGAVYVDNGAPGFYGCSISGNKAGTDGGGIYTTGTRQPYLENTILWGNGTVAGLGEESKGPLRYCCCDAREAGIVDPGMGFCPQDKPNIDVDPEFCCMAPWEDAPSLDGNYYLRPDSPCYDNDPCGLIGALGYNPELPGEVPELTVDHDRDSSITTLTWPPDTSAAECFYQVVRGDATRAVGSGPETCLETGENFLEDTDRPADGTAYRYVVRSRNGLGAGSYGDGAGGERTTNTCP